MRLTYHAQRRIIERQLSQDDLAAALAGRVLVLFSGNHLCYDRHSRCAVIVDPCTCVVLTAYRMQKKDVKRILSDRRAEYE